MAIETAIATGLTPTATGTTSYEATGFGTPQAAIVFMSRAYSGTNPAAEAGLSVGFTDGTTTNVSGFTSDDNVGTSNTQRFSSTSQVVRSGNGGGTTNIEGAFSAWATNGLTINYTKVDATNQYYISVLLIKGCTNVKVATEQLSTSDVITTVGFKANLVFFHTVNNTGTTDNTNASLSFGAAHNNSSDVVTQGCIAFGSTDNQASDITTVAVYNNACIAQAYNNTVQWTSVASAFGASGFTLTAGSNPNDHSSYLAIDTGDTDGVDISVVDSPTATGVTSFEDAGFTPQSVILGASSAPTVNAAHTADPMGMAFGMFDGTTEVSMGVDHDDAAGTTDVQSNYSTNAMQLYEFGGTTHDKMHEATLDSFDSLGYNLDFTTVDGTSRKWLSIAIEGAAVGGGLGIPIAAYHQNHNVGSNL